MTSGCKGSTQLFVHTHAAFLSGACIGDFAQVYVLLFGVGEERQGTYSLRSIDDDELPVHTIVAFASADDASR